MSWLYRIRSTRCGRETEVDVVYEDHWSGCLVEEDSGDEVFDVGIADAGHCLWWVWLMHVYLHFPS